MHEKSVQSSCECVHIPATDFGSGSVCSSARVKDAHEKRFLQESYGGSALEVAGQASDWLADVDLSTSCMIVVGKALQTQSRVSQSIKRRNAGSWRTDCLEVLAVYERMQI